jgi:hypothetical protein
MLRPSKISEWDPTGIVGSLVGSGGIPQIVGLGSHHPTVTRNTGGRGHEDESTECTK